MKRSVKRALKIIGAVAAVCIAGSGGYAWSQASAFDESMSRVYDVPLPTISRSQDPEIIARGKHLAESVTACATRDCHGTDLGGGKPIEMGPVATLVGPNISGDRLASYSDPELARLLRTGIKRDGHSLRFMPVQDFAWLPDVDVQAIVSYLRTVPPVDHGAAPATDIHVLGKVLDRQGKIIFDIARRTTAEKIAAAPPRAATAEYGAELARVCTGCHGDHFSGGPIPGAPSNLPIPPNITPDATGLADWTFDDFSKLLDTGMRKNGKQLDPFMPYVALSKLDDIERHALWAYLRTVPPRPYGQR